VVQERRIFTNEAALGALTIFLVLSGLLLIYSSSSVFSLQHYGNQYHFLVRQFLYACLGIVLMVVFAKTDYQSLRGFAVPLLVLSGLLLLLLWVPGLGKTVRGARRWLDLGIAGFQPSELAKVALVLFLAARLSGTRQERALRDFSGYLRAWIVPVPFLLLVLATRDLGSAVILGAAVVTVFFLADCRWRELGLTLFAGMAAVAFFCLEGYRWKRLLVYRDPWAVPYGAGYQLIQSFLSLGRGGVFGVGFGNGTEKLFYLPDAHTDFIFAVVGEELGLAGCCFFLVLFLSFVVIGVRIALRAPDRFGALTAAGLTFLLGMQVLVNVAVVLGLLPTKGLALPFLSYGGSALLTNLMAVGILISVDRRGVMRAPPRR
jgi:cell division protein FtsW